MSFEQVEATRKLLFSQTLQYWSIHCLFTWQWWFLVALLCVPWVIWWKLVRREKLFEISCYGSFIAIICILLDCFGTNLLLWAYPQHVFPFMTLPVLSLDLSILPIEHMFIYQYFPNWKRFFWALVIAGLLNSFAAEPLFVWAGIYKLYSWQYIYSVPIYIAKGLLVKYLVQRLMNLQSRAVSNR